MRRIAGAVFVIGLLYSSHLHASSPDAAVRILSTRNDNTISNGTGVIISGVGILTCYHVIQGAKTIQVLANNGLPPYANVVVSKISPAYDLALLAVQGLPKTASGLDIVADAPPSLSQNMETYGFPGMFAEQHRQVSLSSNSWVSSETMRTQGGARLFALPNVDLITITMVIYGGVSGAPLISKGHVVGVISGSFDQGGSIAWAIPAKYIAQMTVFGKSPEDVTAWPPLTLMSPQWHSLRSNLSLNANLVFALDTYVAALKAAEPASIHFAAHAGPALLRTQSLLRRIDAEIAARGKNFEVDKAPALQSVLDPDQFAKILPESTSDKLASYKLGVAWRNLEKEVDSYVGTFSEEQQNKLEEEMVAQAEAVDPGGLDALGQFLDLTDPETAPSIFDTSTLDDYKEFYTTEQKILTLLADPAFMKNMNSGLQSVDTLMESLLASKTSSSASCLDHSGAP